MSKSRVRAIVLTMICILLCACGKEEKAVLIETELLLPEEETYQTGSAVKADYVKEVQGSAFLEYAVEENLYCEIKGARLGKFLVNRGDKVKAGDPLVEFELEKSETDIKELELELSRVQRSLASESQQMLAEIELAKGETGWLSINDAELAALRIEKQQLAYETYIYQTNRQIRKLKEEIAELKELANSDTLVAPYDCVVDSTASYREGEQIDLSKPVLRIYSEDSILLEVEDGKKLRYNQPVTITAGKGEDKKVLEGVVISAPNILPSSVSQEVAMIRVSPEATYDMFQGGITYNCLQENLKNVLIVEARALEKEPNASRKDTRRFVYILEDGMIKKRNVKVGLSGTEKAWILDGLTENQTVILNY